MLRGLFGNIAAVAARLLGQLAILPLLFAAWEPERVGTWLLMTAVPAYLALAGNGFAGAGGNMALAAAQAGREEEARDRFVGAWAVATGITGTLCLVYALAAFALAGTSLAAEAIEAGYGDPFDIAAALALLAVYIMAIGQFHLLDIPYRVAGRYGDHTLIGAAGVAGDAVAIAIALGFGDGYAALAGGMAANRILVALTAFVVARRIAPGLFERGRRDLRRGTAGMARPSIALMLLPLVFGLNIQGYALLVGFVLGPALLAAFATTRTLVRLLDVATGFAFTVQFYELGYLQGDRAGMERRILGTATAATLLLGVGFTLAILVLGPWLQTLLSDGDTRFDYAVALALLAAGIVRALANNPVAMLAARNALARTAATYCAASAIGLALAGLLALAKLPLWLVLMPLIAAELVQAVMAFRAMLDHLDERPADFARTLFSRQRSRDISALARRLTGLHRAER